MGAVVALDQLLDTRRVWRGQPTRAPEGSPHSTGHAALDAALPTGGWPPAALTELLLAVDGIGEFALIAPTLAELTRSGERVVVVAPPYQPFAPGWHRAGLDLRQVQIVNCPARDALWATEQCLRSGACAAVVCWPQPADDRAMRRLQVAAETGQCLGFAFRPERVAANPSPVALRVLLNGQTGHLRVLKCRGGLAPAHPIVLSAASRH